MKLVIKQFLQNLKERGELDVIIPDLLSTMGLHVYSVPKTPGVRQYGVDVAAYGSIEGDPSSVYLFSIKAGDLDRKDWNDGIQALRPSLQDILDVYIPRHIPSEYVGRPIVICPCFGGVTREEVAPSISGFCINHKTESISFEIWDGDRIAQFIINYMFSERLLPEPAKSNFQKTLAMIQTPEIALQYFKLVLDCRLRIQTLKMTLWILLGWALAEDNYEVAFQAAEIVVLKAWADMVGNGAPTKKRLKEFDTLLDIYFHISDMYLEKYLPFAKKFYCISAAVNSDSYIDVNIQLFQLLGKLSSICIWNSWRIRRGQTISYEYVTVIRNLIDNNPALRYPLVESQVVDLILALLALQTEQMEKVREIIEACIKGIVSRNLLQSKYLISDILYPSLLRHPSEKSKEYFIEHTNADTILPYLSFFLNRMELSDSPKTYAQLISSNFQHVFFQVMCCGRPLNESKFFSSPNEAKEQVSAYVFDKEKSFFDNLNLIQEWSKTNEAFIKVHCVELDYYPLFVLASRVFHIPLPLQMLQIILRESRCIRSSTD